MNLKYNAYKICVGQNHLADLGKALKPLKLGYDAVIITSPVIQKLYGQAVSGSLAKNGFSVKILTVPDGEKAKSAAYVIRLIEQLARYDVLKRVFIVALGGGVVGDLAGFVAAVYKRGVPYIQVPTTYLAQIDSAIGGKVAIDLSIGKNLVGAFYQPRLVYSDVNVLKTLDLRQIRNGMAEAVKYGIIEDPKLFYYLEKNYQAILDKDLQKLEHVVIRSSQIKTDVVLEDEKETTGRRAILNFGHTVGHAIEAAAGFKYYHHGEAIALGMRVAANISVQLGLLTSKDEQRINQLLSAIGLPKFIQKVQMADILKLMMHDKKFITGKNRFVLAAAIGKVKIVEGIDSGVIKKAIAVYQK